MSFREWFPGKFSPITLDSQGRGASAWLGGPGAPKGVQTDRKQFGAAEKLCILEYGCQGHGVCRAGLGLIDHLGNEKNFVFIPQGPKYASSRLPILAWTFKRSATKFFFQGVDTNDCVASRFVSRFAWPADRRKQRNTC